jgi:hypothetical protein
MGEIKRDPETGRFMKGTGGGPGRPPKKREEKYLERFRRAVTLKEFEEASQVLVNKAIEGDINAIKLLFQYALGNPKQVVEASVHQKSLGVDLQIALEKIYGAESQGDSDS